MPRKHLYLFKRARDKVIAQNSNSGNFTSTATVK